MRGKSFRLSENIWMVFLDDKTLWILILDLFGVNRITSYLFEVELL
jgi:hypothetical protein